MAMVITLHYAFSKPDLGSYAQGWDGKRILVNLAIDHGYPASAYCLVILANCWASPDDHDSWEELQGLADDALMYLNTITHPAYRWAWINDELVLGERS